MTHIKIPEQIARDVLDSHAIRPDWTRRGDQIRTLLIEAANEARVGFKPVVAEPEFAPEGEFDIQRDRWESIRRDDKLGQSGPPFVPNGYEFQIIGTDGLSSERRRVTIYRTSEQTRAFLAGISEEDRA